MAEKRFFFMAALPCFLLRLCDTAKNNQITLNFLYGKTLIAACLGMKPETFSRALSQLKDDTDIQIRDSVVTITDIQKIMDYTCGRCSQSFCCDLGLDDDFHLENENNEQALSKPVPVSPA